MAEDFQSFRSRDRKIVTKPLALNVFIIPLILSQILLRPFFETETNDLINDWASFSYYIIFFLAGFTLLASGNITEAIRKYKLWYLAEVCASTIVMFKVPAMAWSEESGEIIHDVASIFLAWSCAMTATGFAKQYFNRNSALRRLGN